MAVPLHEHAERGVGFRIVKADRHDLVVLDDRLAGIAHQVRVAGGSDLRDCRFTAGVRSLHGRHAAIFDLLQVIGIDAGLDRIGAPEAERVRAFVIVRCGDHDIFETGQILANAFDAGVEEPDDIDGDECDPLVAVAEHDGADHDRVVNLLRFAVLPEPGEVDGLLAEFGSDIEFREADGEVAGEQRRWKKKDRDAYRESNHSSSPTVPRWSDGHFFWVTI